MLTIRPFQNVKTFLHLGVGLFVVLSPLHASITAVATVSSDATPARYGESVINESNTITITITHDGTDAQSAASGGMLDGVAQLWYVFSEEGVPPVIATDCTDEAPGSNCARPWNDPSKAVAIGGNTSVITVTGAELATVDMVSGQEGNNFDFKVVLTPDNTDGGAIVVTRQINGWGDVGDGSREMTRALTHALGHSR